MSFKDLMNQQPLNADHELIATVDATQSTQTIGGSVETIHVSPAAVLTKREDGFYDCNPKPIIKSQRDLMWENSTCVDCGKVSLSVADTGDDPLCPACRQARADRQLDASIAEEDYRKEFPPHAGF